VVPRQARGLAGASEHSLAPALSLMISAADSHPIAPKSGAAGPQLPPALRDHACLRLKFYSHTLPLKFFS